MIGRIDYPSYTKCKALAWFSSYDPIANAHHTAQPQTYRRIGLSTKGGRSCCRGPVYTCSGARLTSQPRYPYHQPYSLLGKTESVDHGCTAAEGNLRKKIPVHTSHLTPSIKYVDGDDPAQYRAYVRKKKVPASVRLRRTSFPTPTKLTGNI